MFMVFIIMINLWIGCIADDVPEGCEGRQDLEGGVEDLEREEGG